MNISRDFPPLRAGALKLLHRESFPICSYIFPPQKHLRDEKSLFAAPSTIRTLKAMKLICNFSDLELAHHHHNWCQ